MYTVNIFGCCCTRNILNYEPAKRYFQVKTYAFQAAIWACFEPSLGIPFEDLQRIEMPEFTRRMLHYDINKVALSEFEKNVTDYFFIDLASISFPVFELHYKGLTTYIQYYTGHLYLPRMTKMSEFPDFSYRQISILDVPSEKVYEGLDRFCDWLLAHYPPNRIILNIPNRARRYTTNEGILRNYPEATIKQYQSLDALIHQYSDYVINRLGDITCYEYQGELIAYDETSGNKAPYPLHYALHNYYEQSSEFTNLVLGKQETICNSITDNLTVEYVRTKNRLMLMEHQLTTGCVFTINTYFNVFKRMLGFKNYIFIFTVREDASTLWKKFEFTEEFSLTHKPSPLNSYIAVYDSEASDTVILDSEKSLCTEYQWNNACFSITSGGTNCLKNGGKTIASVIYNETEYAANIRGLNVVIFSKENHSVIDSFVCDLNRDTTLMIRSTFPQSPFGF